MDKTNKNDAIIDTVMLDEETDSLVIIDQTLLPAETKLLYLTTAEDIYEAIYKLRVRGAPAIGVAAAIGIYILAKRFPERDYKDFVKKFKETKDYLASSRPTAVNLFWALDRMEKRLISAGTESIDELIDALHDEAIAIRDEDIEVCRKLGEYGLSLIKDGDGILTHCNAGRLAAVRYGTALAPIYIGYEKGYRFKVYTDETRPLLQGARLSAYEMQTLGADTTVICDNMASQVMKNGWINAVFTGCDRVAANGDSANKIGTSGVAILAKHYGIPFYIVAPTSTIDMNTETGDDIPIEQRNPDEVTEMWYKKRMAPEGVKVYNPAFDVTDHSLITGIVTEFGIAYPPYTKSLKEIFKRKKEQNS